MSTEPNYHKYIFLQKNTNIFSFIYLYHIFAYFRPLTSKLCTFTMSFSEKRIVLQCQGLWQIKDTEIYSYMKKKCKKS